MYKENDIYNGIFVKFRHVTVLQFHEPDKKVIDFLDGPARSKPSNFEHSTVFETHC